MRLRRVQAIAHNPSVAMQSSAFTQNEIESYRSSTTSVSVELIARQPRSVQYPMLVDELARVSVPCHDARGFAENAQEQFAPNGQVGVLDAPAVADRETVTGTGTKRVTVRRFGYGLIRPCACGMFLQ